MIMIKHEISLVIGLILSNKYYVLQSPNSNQENNTLNSYFSEQESSQTEVSRSMLSMLGFVTNFPASKFLC